MPAATDHPVVRTGFIPLIDAAVLIAASAMGFDRGHGVRLELHREVSWSNIRDRLAFRQFDAAHMLAPMAVASQLGLGSNPYPVIAPFVLGRGGNAVTLSVSLFEATCAAAGSDFRDEAGAHAQTLKRVMAQRREDGLPPLVFGITYPFSSHNYELRFWMAQAGIDPDRDLRLTVVPPPLAADALKAGAIDGFCVNAPWNVLAVEEGVGRIVAVKADIWPASPEKVLGVRPGWWEKNRETGERLLRALDEAARWCDAPANRSALAAILARPEHCGGSGRTLAAILEGSLPVDRHGTHREIPDYLTFHRDGANLPSRDLALWVWSQMMRWGQAPLDPAQADQAASAFRPDLYAAAISPQAALPAPVDFPADDAVAYAQGFAIRAHRGEEDR